jgi:hypothetical protein
MSIAVMSQAIAAPLPEGGRGTVHRVDWHRPLKALVEARMRKAQIEIVYSRPSPRVSSKEPTCLTRRSPLGSNHNLHSSSGRTDSSISMCAQGDILLERVDGLPTTGDAAETAEPDLIVLAHGELSGHRHTVRGRVRLIHDVARARDIPQGLYLGHLHVVGAPARLEHEQHAAIALQPGTYRVRCQRHLEPGDAAIVKD